MPLTWSDWKSVLYFWTLVSLDPVQSPSAYRSPGDLSLQGLTFSPLAEVALPGHQTFHPCVCGAMSEWGLLLCESVGCGGGGQHWPGTASTAGQFSTWELLLGPASLQLKMVAGAVPCSPQWGLEARLGWDLDLPWAQTATTVECLFSFPVICEGLVEAGHVPDCQAGPKCCPKQRWGGGLVWTSVLVGFPSGQVMRVLACWVGTRDGRV